MSLEFKLATWNTFRFVYLNGEQSTLVFVLHSHVELYYTYQCHKVSFDLTDLLDIDQSRKEKLTCRLALKPPEVPSLQVKSSPRVLAISFESELAYDRFVRLLLISKVFYYPKIPTVKYHSSSSTSGSHRMSSWFGSLRGTNSKSAHHSSGDDDHQTNQLELMPARSEQLQNYLHLLGGWKDESGKSV